MRNVLQMLGISLPKPTHTHELRLIGWYGLEIGFKNSILFKGTKENCYAHLEKLAKEQKCGVGLLVNNGGYRVVDLAEEVIQAKKEAGVKLYETLESILETPLPKEIQIKIKLALKEAEVKPFI